MYDYTDIALKKRVWLGLIDMYHVSWIEFRGLYIKDALFSNGFYGQDAHNIIIENNYIDNCYNSGIGFLIDGVQYETDQIDPQDTALWTLNTNIVVRNNELTRCNNGGWSEVISLEGVDGFEVSNNHLYHNLDGLKSSFWGGGGENINCKRSSRNGKVFGNTIHNSRRMGIYVEGWDGHCFNIEVYNNTIYSCQLGVSIA
ncbi:MAG: right-handed parallel beta-helix repeat-containing protein, partial [Bacteroidales bacterium]|nr:right-handed parallel beta-helix repeat-containing protein [Bacteroidales bacterium]